jgi:hypothetical protein
MRKPRPKVFRGRHFQDDIIVLCVRWCLRYSPSYRDLEELMAERGLNLFRDMVRVWFRTRAELIAENLVLRRQLALYQERKARRRRANTGCETSSGRLEPVLPVGTGAGDCQTEHIGSLAPSRISSVLALEIPSSRSPAIAQEPASAHQHNGGRESELG